MSTWRAERDRLRAEIERLEAETSKPPPRWVWPVYEGQSSPHIVRLFWNPETAREFIRLSKEDHPHGWCVGRALKVYSEPEPS